MATTYKTAAVTAGIMPDLGSPAGLVLCRSVRHTLTKKMTTSDKMQMLPMPKGAIILDVILDISASSNSVVDVGDGNSAARFLKSVTGHTGHRVYRMGTDGAKGFMFQLTQDDTIDIALNQSDIDSGQVLALTVMYKMAGSIADEDFD